MTHSIIAPSSAARRRQCSMSTTAEAQFPDANRQEAADGEAAHWALARMLGGHVVTVGEQAANGVFLTDAMVDGAEVMFDDVVRELAPCHLLPSAGAIEQLVRIPRVHPRAFGTPDFRVWLPTAKPTLLLYDFKFGHRIVDVYENAQCIEYVAGVLPEAEAQGWSDLDIRVRVKIVQPRAYNRGGTIREWSFMASDIRPHINLSSHAAHEALGPAPVARTGPECQDCRARHACPTLQRSAYRAIDESSREQPHELPPEALALELDIVTTALERLNARHIGLMEQALTMATKQGRKLPGWTVEHGVGRKRWAKPDASVILMGQLAGVTLAKPVEPITPKQAEAAGFPFHAFPDLVETPRSAAALVRDDGSKAARVFGMVRNLGD